MMKCENNNNHLSQLEGQEVTNKQKASWKMTTIRVINFIFLLPMIVVYNIVTWFQEKITKKSKTRLSHEVRVGQIQSQIRDWIESGSEKKMCTARSNYKSITIQKLEYKSRCNRITIDLPHILGIDQEKRTVKVEPMVTMGELNEYLHSKGWMLPVVPELDDLTIGGLVMGGGVESTSHKYGLFQYTCKAYEMVLADASVVICTQNENEELYSAIPFSYGTLGFLTMAEIDIIPYKPYIKLEYTPVYTTNDSVRVFEEETEKKEFDSVEGIMYSLNEGIIMSGTFVDKRDPSIPLNSIGRWYKPWFYKHAETFLKKNNGDKSFEYIPTKDFFHRHNRPSFWLMKYLFPMGETSAVFRLLYGWILPPKHAMIKYMKAKLMPKNFMDNFYVQDLGVHIKDLKECLELSDKEINIYPIWLCPLKHPNPEHLKEKALFNMEGLHIDVGIYGFCEKPFFHKVKTQQKIERFLIDSQGHIALYAETQLTETTFKEMFGENYKTYEKVRKRLNCEKAFPHVYDKISYAGRGAI